jgi:hypothetical protein
MAFKMQNLFCRTFRMSSLILYFGMKIDRKKEEYAKCYWTQPGADLGFEAGGCRGKARRGCASLYRSLKQNQYISMGCTRHNIHHSSRS